MDKRIFISKVYKQAPDDFLERFAPAIDFTTLSDQEKIHSIINTVKSLPIEDLEWFDHWYLV